jgi:hypothetical protein
MFKPFLVAKLLAAKTDLKQEVSHSSIRTYVRRYKDIIMDEWAKMERNFQKRTNFVRVEVAGAC